MQHGAFHGESPRSRFAIGDLIAGISVAVVIIPQSLAYAELAGMPVYTGLYAAALPPLVAAFFASSTYLQTGPVAMTALLTFGALSTLAEPFSAEYVGLALLLAVIVGLFRLLLGLIGGGGITHFMSNPVVLGFTTGATLLIVASQTSVVFGIQDPPDRLLLRLWDVATRIDDWSWAAIGLSVVTVALVMGARRIHPLLPGVLIAVVIGMALGTIDGAFDLVGDVPEGLPPISLGLPWSELPVLLLSGAIIAVVGFAEPTAIARTFASQDRVRWDPDRELISQGFANIASGLSGGFPVGGSFSRSAIVRFAGAKTRWSGAVVGLVVLAFLPFAGIVSLLPRAVLGAIVIASVIRLVRLRALWRLFRISWGQGLIAVSTFVATLVLAPRIDLAVLFGMAAAAGVHLMREASRMSIDIHFDGSTLTMSPAGVLFYASAQTFIDRFIEELAAYPDINKLVIDLEGIGRLDLGGTMELKTLVWDARQAGIEVEMVNIPPHAQGVMSRADEFIAKAGGGRPNPLAG